MKKLRESTFRDLRLELVEDEILASITGGCDT